MWWVRFFNPESRLHPDGVGITSGNPEPLNLGRYLNIKGFDRALKLDKRLEGRKSVILKFWSVKEHLAILPSNA